MVEFTTLHVVNVCTGYTINTLFPQPLGLGVLLYPRPETVCPVGQRSSVPKKLDKLKGNQL